MDDAATVLTFEDLADALRSAPSPTADDASIKWDRPAPRQQEEGPPFSRGASCCSEERGPLRTTALVAWKFTRDRRQRQGRSIVPKDEGQPDFALIYRGDAQVTPRMAAHLWSAALFLADTYRDGDQLDLLRQEVPPVARRLTDDAWMQRFVSCFDALARRLASGTFPSEQLASCTAEEMALHLVIDLAEDFVSDGTFPTQDQLPAYGEADTDFEWAREVLFRDHDVLMLFNASLDGIEDDSNEISAEFRFANLHPRDWFVTFSDQLSL